MTELVNQVSEEGSSQSDETPGTKALGVGIHHVSGIIGRRPVWLEECDQEKDRKHEMRTEEVEVEGRWFDLINHCKVTDVCPEWKGSHCRVLSRGRII